MPKGYRKDGTKIIPPSNKGKPRSVEHSRKISEAKTGKKRGPHSEETKKKIGEAGKGKVGHWKGKKLSEETRKRMSKSRTGKKRSLETRKKLSEAKKGERNPQWLGGKTGENCRIRNSMEYKLWRKAVYERDKWECRFCGKHGGKIHADHIKPFCDYPELRLAIDNGRTLCAECHRKTPTYGVKKK